MHNNFFKFFILFFFFTACGTVTPTVNQKEMLRLSEQLQTLDEEISYEESVQLSHDIFTQVKVLTKEFKLTSPALWHNFLVNTGIRDKGLCYHWSDALYKHLIQKQYSSFEFHLVVANIGEYWREHNALVVVSKGGKVEEGILIDPWRNSGVIYFSKVEKDTKYHWVHRPQRACLH